MNDILEYEVLKKGDEEYPKQLYELKDMPRELYVVGNKKLLNEFSIAIVGSRRCLEESEKLASEISYDLSINNINIISGLACRN